MRDRENLHGIEESRRKKEKCRKSNWGLEIILSKL